jgi:8-oxo-dGTP diphosphatase
MTSATFTFLNFSHNIGPVPFSKAFMNKAKHRTFATGIALVRNAEGKYLFLRRSQEESFGAGQWDVPGGSKEFLEQPMAAAARECQEESGLRVVPKRLIWNHVVRGSLDHNVEFVCCLYLCETTENTVRLSNEHDDFAWLSMSEAKTLPVVDWMRDFFGAVDDGSVNLN